LARAINAGVAEQPDFKLRHDRKRATEVSFDARCPVDSGRVGATRDGFHRGVPLDVNAGLVVALGLRGWAEREHSARIPQRQTPRPVRYGD